MRINTNTIGNYFTQSTRNILNTKRPENIQKPAELKEAEVTISAKEKELFAKMYPQKREEIMEYHYYGKDGAMSGVTVGSLLDRRG